MIRLATCLLVVGVLSGGVFLLTGSPAPVDPFADDPPSLLEYDEDGLRYTYHLPTGSESLHDLRSDPRMLRNLIVERAHDAQRLHRALEARIGVTDLNLLRRDWSERIKALESLGYL